MQLTISGSSLLHLPQTQRFSLAAAAGFDGIELVITPEVWRKGADFVSRLAEKYELPVLTLHPPMQRMHEWDRNGWYVNSMHVAMQIPTCRLIVFHTPNTALWDSPRGRWYKESIRRCRAMSDRVQIAIETSNAETRSKDGVRNQKPLLYYYDDLRRFVDEEDLQVTFDTCHASTTPDGLMAAYERLHDRIANIHFSDMRDMSRFPGFIRRNRRVHRFIMRHYTPGWGTLPLEQFVHRLVRDGYARTLTFEETPVAMPFWSKYYTLKHLRKVIAYWREQIAASTLHPSSP